MRPLNGLTNPRLSPKRRAIRVTQADGTAKTLWFRNIQGRPFAHTNTAGIHLVEEMGREQIQVISQLPGGGLLIDVFSQTGWLEETRHQGRRAMTTTYANGDDTIKAISRTSNRYEGGRLSVASDGTSRLQRYLPGRIEMTVSSDQEGLRRSLTLEQIGGTGTVRIARSDDRISWLIVGATDVVEARFTIDEDAPPAETAAKLTTAITSSLQTAMRSPGRTLSVSPELATQVHRLAKAAARLDADDPLHAAVVAVANSL